MLRLRTPLVLASRSPRRQQLLQRLGLELDVQPSDVAEDIPPSLAPGKTVEVLALRKADAVALTRPHALTLGADTIVVLDGDVLGKPGDEAEALLMLERLSGRTHEVFSGIALVHPESGRSATTHVRTYVTFAPLDFGEIEAYVATGSPLDKAGSYGIQDDLGALLIERIDGDYYNVVGLPLRRLYEILKRDFGDLLVADR